MKKHNEGFSLIETVAAMAILGLIVVPCCSALLMSIRMNDRAQETMHAQLAVSSAVETLMAEGISGKVVDDIAFTSKFENEIKPEEANKRSYDFYTVDEHGVIVSTDVDRFSNVMISVKREEEGDLFYTVTVKDNAELVEITTTIRDKEVG